MLQDSSGKPWLICVIFAAAVFAWIATAPGSQQQRKLDKEKAFRGADTFRVYCASCHGREAKGDGPLAKDLNVQPANLTELSAPNGGEFPYAMVVETIEHGRDVRGHGTEDMPAWGDAFQMTSENEAQARARIDELANFLWSRQTAAP